MGPRLGPGPKLSLPIRLELSREDAEQLLTSERRHEKDSMRSLPAVFEDATALFAEAGALLARARGIRQELEQAKAAGVDEAQRIVHGALVAGIESGPSQGLEVALRELRQAQALAGDAEPAWLRRLLDELN